jgi:hypothetical protein
VTETTQTPTARAARTRLVVSIALLTLAVALTPLTVVAAWARAQIEDTDRYVDTVAPLAQDPAVQAYVARAAADAVYDLLDVEAVVSGLPDELSGLGATVAPAVRGFLIDAASRFTASQAFQELWNQAHRSAHAVISGVLTGDSALTDLEGGQLTLDLGALLERFQTDLVDAGFSLAGQIDLGAADRTIVLVEGEQLRSIETARSLVGQLESLSWVLFLATVGVAVGSVVVAPDGRRGVMRLGVGVAFSMVLVAIGLSIARRAFLGALAEELPRPVASGFFDAVVDSMRTGFRGTFVFGLVVALLVLIASRHDFADRWARPTQVTVGAVGVVAIVAREEPNGAYVVFMVVLTVIGVSVLEAVRQRRLREPVAPPQLAP